MQFEEIGGWFFQGAARSLLESVAAARRVLAQRSMLKATRRVNLGPSANQTMSVDPRVLLERAEDIILRILENPDAPRECPLCEGLMWDVRPFYDVADQIERAVPGVVTLPLPRLAADGSSSPDRWECDACGAFTITRSPTAGAKTWPREAGSFGGERFPAEVFDRYGGAVEVRLRGKRWEILLGNEWIGILRNAEDRFRERALLRWCLV